MSNPFLEIIDLHIATSDDAKSFLDTMVSEGYFYHLEDNPAEIIKGDSKDACEPLFTAEQVFHIRNRVAELYSFDWGSYKCPLGYVIDESLME